MPNRGNAFIDLEFDNPEERLLHATLAIESSGKSMAVAAKATGLSRKVLIDLIDSPFDLSSGQLLVLLNRLGQNVEIVVSPVAPGEREAKITVRSGGERAAA